jgi:hypothetical protein
MEGFGINISLAGQYGYDGITPVKIPNQLYFMQASAFEHPGNDHPFRCLFIHGSAVHIPEIDWIKFP